ncbi:hypothetical protein AN1107.2 [Aspergillus nidulans FGSC A4]|uniref:Cell-associated beta-galactosidase, putative (AFU_orthologue AFUA_5G14090) n=1 Tax=Emericella nidulans (strain FGSC A4 / ATCC 38163 / CBS 112.46 / NRRL 194 / M139) TaxID=227321 RepID=Q5BEC3_EMENI|nr:hypothetical protein [Aspergillus nidulans FGSC A4]EAA66225.1 hypothetical protein AN1107.2 [Aspergillus nidulans FGSC A4]CBF88126.1 TPA: cell-associated beta-galactosidase, putative (AFU_orthologue; AFUA_5G14090) [Aspergillus nidulans FGSC A4]|eukprot:XP_658711.1 hypothetical protein AN1107.2 [Aspergillus nidulans FGSC A4]
MPDLRRTHERDEGAKRYLRSTWWTSRGLREMLDSEVAEYGGEMLYINKDSRNPFWQMEYSRDEGLRKLHAIEDVERWSDYYEQQPGTGTRVNSGGVNIIFSDSNTHHRGAENYRRSGEVDPVQLPKDSCIRLASRTAPNVFVANGADIALVDVEGPAASPLTRIHASWRVLSSLTSGSGSPQRDSWLAESNSTASTGNNEETTWRSDSDQDTAWIEYSWEEPLNVSQLVMKQRSFRTERYPIKVSVGDTIDFEGESLKVAMDENDDLGVIEAEIYTPA